MQQVEVECGEGDGAYVVRITGESLAAFVAASRSLSVKGKEGEALVAALVVALPGLKNVRRLKDGRLNDGPDGEPAEQYFNDQRLVAATFYRDGTFIRNLDRYAVWDWRPPCVKADAVTSIQSSVPKLKIL